MSKHTPGPWVIRQGDEWTNSIVTQHGTLPNGEANDWEVASYNLRRDEAKANARLIAAAPELLEALRVAFGHVDRDTHWNDHALIAAVLAKLEGV